MSNYLRVKGEKCKVYNLHNSDEDMDMTQLKMGDIICVHECDREYWGYRLVYKTDDKFIIQKKEDCEFLDIDVLISENIEDPRDFYTTDEMECAKLTIELCKKHQDIYGVEYLNHDAFETFEEFEESEK